MIGPYLWTHTDGTQCFYGAKWENFALTEKELYSGDFLELGS